MGNELRHLRLNNSLPAAEIVAPIREVFPKFDKTLLSKCEHPEDYGVEPCKKAVEAAYLKHDPEGWKKRRSADRHKNHWRIACRMDEATYTRLLERLHQAGYKTVQDWLLEQVTAYIKEDCS